MKAHEQRPDRAKVGASKSWAGGPDTSEGTAIVHPIEVGALPEDQGDPLEPIEVVDARRRAYFELAAYLRGAA